jgi:hypothetical protein
MRWRQGEGKPAPVRIGTVSDREQSKIVFVHHPTGNKQAISFVLLWIAKATLFDSISSNPRINASKKMRERARNGNFLTDADQFGSALFDHTGRETRTGTELFHGHRQPRSSRRLSLHSIFTRHSCRKEAAARQIVQEHQSTGRPTTRGFASGSRTFASADAVGRQSC